MAYNNVEILTAVLVTACLLLLYCKVSVKTSEKMHGSPQVPGIHFAEGYTARPKHGSYSVKDGLEVSRSDVVPTMHGLETRQTPASALASTSTSISPEMNWVPDASIPLNCFNAELNSVEFSPDDMRVMEREVLERQSNRSGVNSSAPRSLCGAIMSYTEPGVSNTHVSRELTH